MSVENLKKLKNEKGFTIVELLIVIVVIGILAALVIVAYNGVTARANATKAQTNAATVQKKAEAFNSDTSGGNGLYPACAATNPCVASGPTAFNNITGLGALPSGLTTQATAPTGANGTTVVQYIACGESSAGNNSATGYVVGWWNFGASPAAVNYYTGGSATGSGGTGNGTYTAYTCPATASTM